MGLAGEHRVARLLDLHVTVLRACDKNAGERRAAREQGDRLGHVAWPGVGLNPFRQQKRRSSDYVLVAAAVVVILLLVLWAAIPR